MPVITCSAHWLWRDSKFTFLNSKENLRKSSQWKRSSRLSSFKHQDRFRFWSLFTNISLNQNSLRKSSLASKTNTKTGNLEAQTELYTMKISLESQDFTTNKHKSRLYRWQVIFLTTFLISTQSTALTTWTSISTSWKKALKLNWEWSHLTNLDCHSKMKFNGLLVA